MYVFIDKCLCCFSGETCSWVMLLCVELYDRRKEKSFLPRLLPLTTIHYPFSYSWNNAYASVSLISSTGLNTILNDKGRKVFMILVRIMLISNFFKGKKTILAHSPAIYKNRCWILPTATLQKDNTGNTNDVSKRGYKLPLLFLHWISPGPLCVFVDHIA